MDKILATKEKMIAAPLGAQSVYPKGIRSVYQLVARVGYQGEIYTCAEVTHYNADTGNIITSNAIKNSKNPDIAWNAYQAALKNNEWGTQ